jgi:hypothetical protein
MSWLVERRGEEFMNCVLLLTWLARSQLDKTLALGG